MKEKYGSDYESGDEDEDDDSEEDESEDEDGYELTPAMDAAILRTLSRIKNRDPEIYNLDKGIFEGDHHHITFMRIVASYPSDCNRGAEEDG